MGAFGKAGLDFLVGLHDENIIVESQTMEDDVIPVEHLFRDWNDMPICEQIALKKAKGKVLDVGGGVGSHSLHLQQKGVDVTMLEIEAELCEVAQKRGVENIVLADFFEFNSAEKYETILFMMNGIGIGGNFETFKACISKCESLLNKGGQILFDSTDIAFCYEDEDGSVLLPLNIEYHGFVQFRLTYKKETDDWFDWAYYSADKIMELLPENAKLEVLKEEGPAYAGAITFD